MTPAEKEKIVDIVQYVVLMRTDAEKAILNAAQGQEILAETHAGLVKNHERQIRRILSTLIGEDIKVFNHVYQGG